MAGKDKGQNERKERSGDEGKHGGDPTVDLRRRAPLYTSVPCTPSCLRNFSLIVHFRRSSMVKASIEANLGGGAKGTLSKSAGKFGSKQMRRDWPKLLSHIRNRDRIWAFLLSGAKLLGDLRVGCCMGSSERSMDFDVQGAWAKEHQLVRLLLSASLHEFDGFQGGRSS